MAEEFNVLVCVDGSPQSEHAFENYIKMHHKPENKVVLFFAGDPIFVPTFSSNYMAITPDTIAKETKDKEAQALKLNEKFSKIAKDKGLSKYEFIQVCNTVSAGESICSYAKEHSFNSIVIGTRGLGKIRRTILGSVSDYVVHHAHIPVTVVPMH